MTGYTGTAIHRLPILDTIVVGATRRPLPLYLVDENGTPVSLTGSSSATLKGESADLPALHLSVAATIVDGPSGAISVTPAAGIAQSDLTSAGKKRATFVCYVAYTDSAGKSDKTKPFRLVFAQDPLQAP